MKTATTRNFRWLETNSLIFLSVLSFVSSECPAPPPCTCQYTIIYCDKLNLTEVPQFSKPADDKSLWDVELHNNKIKKIPNGVFKNLKLQMLLLFENEIEVVEDNAFDGSENTLYVLHLYGNKLTSIPSAVGKLKLLMGLDIHDNPMPTIRNDVIRNISSTISSIMFGNPEMKSWPRAIYLLQNLTSISVEDIDNLYIPDDALRNFPFLSIFQMISTNVKSLPSSLGSRSYMESISLVNNPMLTEKEFRPEIFSHLHHVQNINIMNSSLKTFPEIFFNMSSLYVLQLANNPISSIPDNVFPLNFSPMFWFMSLRNTSLTCVPKTFSNLTSLKRLDFMISLIKEIKDEDFKNMTNLERMYLTDNPLQIVSDNAFVDLKSLKFLTLDNTHLTTIPKAIMNLPSLTELSLDINRILCTCENLGWIKNWSRRTEVEIYGSCANIRMTLTLYIYMELPKCK